MSVELFVLYFVFISFVIGSIEAYLLLFKTYKENYTTREYERVKHPLWMYIVIPAITIIPVLGALVNSGLLTSLDPNYKIMSKLTKEY